MRAPFKSLVFLALLLPALCYSLEWSGKVVDLRTGEPISGVDVCAGVPGRVDYGECMKTGTDGSFSVSYPEDFSGDDAVLYVSPTGELRNFYLSTVLCGKPSNVTVRLVPAEFFVKVRVIDGDSRNPIPSADVYFSSTIGGYTDQEGLFEFNVYGPVNVYRLNSSGLIPEGIEGVPAEFRCSDVEEEALNDHRLSVSARGYKPVDFRLPVKTSTTEDIFTYCLVELFSEDSEKESKASCQIVENGEIPPIQEDAYSKGFEDGKEWCRKHPDECGIEISTPSSECAATYDMLSNTLFIPNFENQYWLEFSIINWNPVQLELKDYGLR